MKLTATPFNPTTGELLPVYRDAYLRGDLSRTSAQAVEAYLRRDTHQAHDTVTRWYEIHSTEEIAVIPNWVQTQLRFIREEPQRFRRRVFTLIAASALIAGASMASNMRPAKMQPLATMPLSILNTLPVAEMNAATAMATRMVLVKGRILNEKGQPLAGATVLQKGTSQCTSTDANGNYSLSVPANATTLQFGYGGYAEQEIAPAEANTTAVTLQPRAPKHRRWLFF